jgi:DNA-directed RNA polymerase sigma subunit (sigma70/sigma32)
MMSVEVTILTHWMYPGMMLPEEYKAGRSLLRYFYQERLDDDERTALWAGTTARNQAILTARLGLEGGSPRTLRDVGQEFAITGGRVRQIEARLFRTLGRYLLYQHTPA